MREGVDDVRERMECTEGYCALSDQGSSKVGGIFAGGVQLQSTHQNSAPEQ